MVCALLSTIEHRRCLCLLLRYMLLLERGWLIRVLLLGLLLLKRVRLLSLHRLLHLRLLLDRLKSREVRV